MLYVISVLQLLVSFTSLMDFNLEVLLWQFVTRKVLHSSSLPCHMVLYDHITVFVWSHYIFCVITSHVLYDHITYFVWSLRIFCMITSHIFCMITSHILNDRTTYFVWSHHIFCMMTSHILYDHITCFVWFHHIFHMITSHILYDHITYFVWSHHIFCMITHMFSNTVCLIVQLQWSLLKTEMNNMRSV